MGGGREKHSLRSSLHLDLYRSPSTHRCGVLALKCLPQYARLDEELCPCFYLHPSSTPHACRSGTSNALKHTDGHRDRYTLKAVQIMGRSDIREDG